MSEDPPRRKTLGLKPGVVISRPLGPEPLTPLRPARLNRPLKFSKPPPAPAKPTFGWKCKPCGEGFDPPVAAPEDQEVRCPSCNAKIGKAADFAKDTPPNRLRARRVKV